MKNSFPRRPALAVITALMVLGGCASIPTGPSAMVLPGTGKNFDQFRADDYECRQYAGAQTGTTASDAAVNSGMTSAAVGTAVGAVAGAAVGGRQGAGVGAGAGLIMGAMAGSGAAQGSARGTQRRYDIAYEQCMYAKGHKVPVSGNFTQSGSPENTRRPTYAPPPPPPPGWR